MLNVKDTNSEILALKRLADGLRKPQDALLTTMPFELLSAIVTLTSRSDMEDLNPASVVAHNAAVIGLIDRWLLLHPEHSQPQTVEST